MIGKVVIVFIISDDMSDVFVNTIILSNGYMVVKLWHLKKCRN